MDKEKTEREMMKAYLDSMRAPTPERRAEAKVKMARLVEMIEKEEEERWN